MRKKTNNPEQTETRRRAICQSVIISNRLTEYYDYDEAALWWRSPHPQLQGRVPADVIFEQHGNEAIRKILDRLDSDAYL